MGFKDMEKAYDRVNRKALWHMLRMYDVGGKMLSGIKTMYVDSLACVNVKGDERVGYDKLWGETRVYCVPLGFQCIYGHSDEGGKRVEITWTLVLCR